MTEFLGQDVSNPLALEEHKAKVGQAIEAIEKQEADKADGAKRDGAALAGAAMETAKSIFWSEVRVTQQASAAVDAAKTENTLFVGGGRGTGKASASKFAPLVPMTYSEKVAAAKKAPPASPAEVLAKTVITHQSLTGASLTLPMPAPIQGAAMSKRGTEDLKREMEVVQKALEDPLKHDPKRLEQDLKNNTQNAQEQVKKVDPATLAPPSPHFGLTPWGSGQHKKDGSDTGKSST